MPFPNSPKKVYKTGSISIMTFTLLYVKGTRLFVWQQHIESMWDFIGGQSFHFMATSVHHLVPIRSAISQR